MKDEQFYKDLDNAYDRSTFVVDVVVSENPNGSYRYTAVYPNNKTEVIRKQATKLYDRAFAYDISVCTGKPGLGAFFTFGKNPASYHKDQLRRVFEIDK
jgi:hypothetical protein